MTDDKKNIEKEPLHKLLLSYKYLNTLRKITHGVTHQYNNIFTGLSGQLRTRKQDTDSDGVLEKRAELIEDLLRRGMEQTEILFTFSRDGEMGKKAYAPQRLAGKAIDLLNTISRLHRFHLQAEDDLPKIRVRQRDIILMLFYLGENAIAAMDQGGEITLQVSSLPEWEGNGAVRFNLVDTGSGVTDTALTDSIDRVACAGDKESIAGIGLYAVRTIVDEHGGTFNLRQVCGGGTSAVVDFPALEKVRQNGRTALNPSEILHSQNSRPKKHVFLVVDDEEAMRDMLCQRLQRRNHVSFCVESCQKALVEFRLLADTVTVILIDVGLPDASGYECARQLRSITAEVQIILMSGMDADQKKLTDSGAEFLMKPFTIEQLEQLVNDV